MTTLKLNDPNVIVTTFYGELNWQRVGCFVDDMIEALSTNQSITNMVILFSSSGGEIDPSWGLYSSLSTFDVKLTTVAVGKVYSACVLPYLAGDRRYVMPCTNFLLHPSSACYEHAERTIFQLQDEIKGEKVDTLSFRDVLAKKINPNYVESYCRPKQAIFIDEKDAIITGLAHKKVEKLSEIELY
jgi:ATP-dependent protease ClpP protease subunit